MLFLPAWLLTRSPLQCLSFSLCRESTPTPSLASLKIALCFQFLPLNGLRCTSLWFIQLGVLCASCICGLVFIINLENSQPLQHQIFILDHLFSPSGIVIILVTFFYYYCILLGYCLLGFPFSFLLDFQFGEFLLTNFQGHEFFPKPYLVDLWPYPRQCSFLSQCSWFLAFPYDIFIEYLSVFLHFSSVACWSFFSLESLPY